MPILAKFMEQQLSILVIPGHTIYPLVSGGAFVQFNFLKVIQHRHTIHLVVTPDNVAAQDIETLRTELPNVHIIPLGFSKETAWQKTSFFVKKQRRKWSKKDVAYTLWKHPFINNFLIKQPEIVTEIIQVSRGQKWDLILVEHTKNLPLLALMPLGSKVVYVHHELYYLRVQQELSLLAYDTDYIAYITELVSAIEVHYLNKAAGVVVFTKEDETLLQDKGVKVPLHVSNPFFLTETTARIYHPQLPPNLVFIGGEGHHPNKEGLVWFLDNVFPQLPSALQQTTIAVTGDWSDTFKNQYASFPLKFLGFVPSLDDVLKNGVLIAPIRIGSGVRIKICTAMSKGVPVVSTRLGASGIDGLINEENIMLADTEEEFAKATAEVLQNESLREKLSLNVWELSQRIFSEETFVNNRLQFYEAIATSPA